MSLPDLIAILIAIPGAIASILDITEHLKEFTHKARNKPGTQEHAEQEGVMPERHRLSAGEGNLQH